MASPRRRPQVINLNEVEARNIGIGSKFGTATKQLGFPTGARPSCRVFICCVPDF